MKGFVLSIKRDNIKEKHYHPRRISKFSIRRFLSYYGTHCVFFVLVLCGLIWGASDYKEVSVDYLNKLDFLFLTNLDRRLNLSAFGVFCSSLSTGFLFVLCNFLLAFSAWGALALPFVSVFKGYGIGISAAYLFAKYSLSGIGFYILVILPGTTLFLFTFLVSLKESFFSSLGLLRVFLTSKTEALSHKYINTYLYKNFIILIFTVSSAVFDMLLWMLFANLFKF